MAQKTNGQLICPSQVRAARAWLNWTQEDLAEKSGISQKSIARFELQRSVPYADTLVKLRETFEAAGIRFEFDGMAARGIYCVPTTHTQ